MKPDVACVLPGRKNLVGHLALIALTLLPTWAYAFGLGNASTSSRVGEPLVVEIPIQAGEADTVEVSCIRLLPPPAGYMDDLPWQRTGRLRVEKRANERVLIITTQPVQHPAVMIGVHIDCGVEMRRNYTLLLNPPDEVLGAQAISEPPVLKAKPAGPLPSASVRETGAHENSSLWETREGESADSIAKALLPGSAVAQRRYAKNILSANRNLPGVPARTRQTFAPGTRLNIPAVPTVSAEAGAVPRPMREEASPRNADSPKPASVPRAERKTSVARNRLLVTEGGEGSLQLSTSIDNRPELTEQERARLRSEMQLIAALDERIAQQMELTERLRQLEAVQQKLRTDYARLEEQLRQASVTGSSTPAVVVMATQLGATGDSSNTQSWYRSSTVIGLALAVLAGVLTALLWRLRRHRSSKAGFKVHGDAESPNTSEALVEPLTIDDIWPEDNVQMPEGAKSGVAAIEGAIGPMSVARLGPLSLLQINDDVEEHDSAVELAEIMMSFGRVQGAAQTLSDFIRANPKQAVRPWIKLLEVYRVANMRMEFEALTTQLNKAFNVKSPTWDEIEVVPGDPESLEGHPHIIKSLCESWGTQACQVYLHNLLRDNRQGTRQGFPLAVVDEILLLLAILESNLGPYRHVPATDEPADKSTKISSQPTLVVAATTAVPPFPSPSRMAEPLVLESPPVSTNTTPLSDDDDPLGEIDFNLDSTDLTRTLHINLDELTDLGAVVDNERDKRR